MLVTICLQTNSNSLISKYSMSLDGRGRFPIDVKWVRPISCRMHTLQADMSLLGVSEIKETYYMIRNTFDPQRQQSTYSSNEEEVQSAYC